MKSEFYEIQEADMFKPMLEAFGQKWLKSSFIGRVLPQDVGKRCYLVDGIIQVENKEQFETRKKREQAEHFKIAPPRAYRVELLVYESLDRYTQIWQGITRVVAYNQAVVIQDLIDPVGDCSRVVGVYI